MKLKRKSKKIKSRIRIFILSVILIMTAIGIGGISKNSGKINIVHTVKEQVRLVAEQIQEVLSGKKLILNTKVNLSAANGRGGVDLDWLDYDITGKVLKVYQKKEDVKSSSWESISTFDFYSEGIEPIKVLNIYPDNTSGTWAVQKATFNYLDGSSEVLPKSASLKVWMEGGTINNVSFKAYGVNPITGEQIIKVTPVSNTEFNNNPNIIWNYDVVMIGTWDGNGGQSPDNNALKIIEEYIKAGFGILVGHDTLYGGNNLQVLSPYFNISLSGGNGGSGSSIMVCKTGALTNFPYELPLNATLTIPYTHTMSQNPLGNIWMSFVGTANSCYLTTWNNTAMTQTGHSNCESTEDERKVLANTLFYLKQRTTVKSFTDNSSQDLKEPDAPIISASRVGATKNIEVSYNAKDNGSKYSFYAEAYDSKDSSIKIETSNQRTEIVTTGIKGYYYIIDNDSSNKNFDINANGITYIEDKSLIIDLSNNDKYVHMKAIDVAGNVSLPSVIKINVNTDEPVKLILELDGGILEGEEGPIEKLAFIGDIVELEIPEKEGNKFEGWYLDSECTKKVITSNYLIKEDVTLYAKWEKDYTITIDNESEGHTYNSYQIFQGTYYEKEKKIINENGEEKIIKIPILSNIEWSKELQKEVEEGKIHGDKILELLKEKNPDLYIECETAEDIAKVLQGKPNDGDAIKEFTDIVGKYILENNIPITKGTSTVVEGTDLDGNIDKNYKITHLDPGYYIVIDAKANEKNDAYSRYLIDVVQDVTMNPKISIPRLNKKVKGNNIKTLVSGIDGESSAEYVEDEKRNTATYKKESEIYNAEDYDIEFELKSSIPDIEGYSVYKFEVVDILAKGFDYDRNSVKVMLGESEYPKTREKTVKEETSESTKVENPEEIINPENGEEIIQNSESKKEIVKNYTIRDVVIDASNYETFKKYFEEEGKEYPEGYAESNYGKTLILVELKDLVEQVNAGIVEKGQDIFIKYKAKLNGKGEVGNTPNINEAYIKYSNNPYNSESITQTTTQTTYTYTIDLNISKIAEIKKSINNSNSENENLVVENNNSENGNLVEDTENLEDSQTSEQLKYLEGAEFEIYNKPKKDRDRKPITTVTTNELGKVLYSSLGAGTYYIKETKSPEGYNKLREEIVIEVKAVCDEYGTITWTVEDKTNSNLVLVQMGVKEETEISEIKLQVQNTSGLQLPITGGTGTLIFTIIGLSIMLITIICLKSNRKKKI